MKSDDLFQAITDNIVTAIERGAGDWSMPWRAMADAGTPVSVDKRAYRGLNALWLAVLAADRGYSSGTWATYKAWKRHGSQVRRGEKGTAVLLWKQATRRETDEATGEERARGYLLARTFTVFGAEQCDGAAAEAACAPRPDRDSEERIAEADAFFARWPVPVDERGNRAYYDRGADRIAVPPFAAFDQPADFYSTLAHEAVHSTGHGSRLDRTFGKRFGDDAYAMEELVAELGAAFYCGAAGISQTPRPDHAAYLSHWLRVLRSDPRALLTTTSKAQAAVDLLWSTCADERAQVAA